MSSAFLLHPWFFVSLVIGCQFPPPLQKKNKCLHNILYFLRLKDKSDMACSATSETQNKSLNKCLTRQHLLKPKTTHDRVRACFGGNILIMMMGFFLQLTHTDRDCSVWNKEDKLHILGVLIWCRGGNDVVFAHYRCRMVLAQEIEISLLFVSDSTFSIVCGVRACHVCTLLFRTFDHARGGLLKNRMQKVMAVVSNFVHFFNSRKRKLVEEVH